MFINNKLDHFRCLKCRLLLPHFILNLRETLPIIREHKKVTRLHNQLHLHGVDQSNKYFNDDQLEIKFAKKLIELNDSD